MSYVIEVYTKCEAEREFDWFSVMFLVPFFLLACTRIFVSPMKKKLCFLFV
jgi:hypothetical protein